MSNIPEKSDTAPAIPAYSPGPRLRLTRSGFDFLPTPPSDAECNDVTQQTLFQRLRRYVKSLADRIEQIHNTNPDLAAIVEDYRKLLPPKISDLDVASLWIMGSALQSTVNAIEADVAGPKLEPRVFAYFRTVFIVHAAFIQGFAEGRRLTTGGAIHLGPAQSDPA